MATVRRATLPPEADSGQPSPERLERMARRRYQDPEPKTGGEMVVYTPLAR